MSNELNQPRVKLSGEDGNAYAILARCKRAADKAKWPAERWKVFFAEAKAGNYDELIRAVMRNFDVR